MDKWTDNSLGYIGFGLAGAVLGLFSYGLLGMLIGATIGLVGAYGLSRVNDDKNAPKTWLNKLTDWMG